MLSPCAQGNMFPEEMVNQELEVQGKDWNSEWSYVKIPENVQKQNYDDGAVETQADEIKNETSQAEQGHTRVPSSSSSNWTQSIQQSSNLLALFN